LKRRNSPVIGPFALVETVAHVTRLSAVNMVASRMKLVAGMTLADAMSMVPALITAKADPQGDQAALERLADWCCRYSPWVALDGSDGIIMEVTGVPHLFGGEEGMLTQMQAAFRRMQIGLRLAIAESPAAAWAWARYGTCGPLPDRPASFDLLASLPVAALRIERDTADVLTSLGLKTIGDIANLQRAPLVKRFGRQLLDRLDRLLARQDEPISPRQYPAPWRSRANLPEPISTREAIDLLLIQLLEALCSLLEKEHLGARRLALHAYRVDGDVQTLNVGTSYPSRNPKHLARLFRDPLDGIMPGFGFETFILEAISADPFSAEQADLEAGSQRGSSFAQLIDRLQSRLGARSVFRYEPVERHAPENSAIRVPSLAESNGEMPRSRPRPVRLMQPESIELETTGEAFTWRRIRRRIAKAIGPERIQGEWIDEGMNIIARDYYQIEDEVGRRYWIYRTEGTWYLHGLFA
jgi:protein ImuB